MLPTDAPDPVGGAGRQAAFSALLVSAMAVATFTPFAVGLLATFLIDDFDITRGQVGLLIAVTTVLGAVASPLAGRITDAVGGRWAAAGLFAAGAVGFLAMAASPAYLILFVPMLIAGLSQAGGNPATNKLIAQHLPIGRRGFVTGVKQSGVQLGVFLGGLLVPAGAEVWGWRWAVLLVAVVPLVALPVVFLVIPPDRLQRVERHRDGRGPLPPAIGWLFAYGTLLGFGGAFTFLIPLFVEESLGLTPRVGGAAAAIIGLTGIFGRVLWARAAERGPRFESSLLWIAALSVAATVALYASTWAGVWLMWVGSVGTGLTASSWNSVGMLAVMHEAGPARAGRASGVVMLGFLAGLGSAPPLFGWTVDETGSYTLMWVIAIAVLVAGTLVAAEWTRRSRSS